MALCHKKVGDPCFSIIQYNAILPDNACNHFVQDILCSHLPSKNRNIKIIQNCNFADCSTWVLENRVLRKTFGLRGRKRHETGENCIVRSFMIFISHQLFRSKTEAKCGTYGGRRELYTGTLVGKYEGKRPVGGPRHRWEEHIKLVLKKRRSWTVLNWLSNRDRLL
jgi:hypothetical protein